MVAVDDRSRQTADVFSVVFLAVLVCAEWCWLWLVGTEGPTHSH
jgi:hypothetical protein